MTNLAFDYLTGALEAGPYPASITRKFTAQGQVLPTPGNTTLCHVDPASPAHGHLTAAQAALMSGPHADAFAFLPPASFHMTIFEGVIDYTRTRARWPEPLPLNASVDAVTALFDQRLRGLELAQSFDVRPVELFAGFSVTMDGIDAAATRLLRDTRDQLRDATGLRRPDHDSYRFHITLGYLLRWLTAAEARDTLALAADVGARLITDMPRLTLGPVEFCSFETMHHFAPRHVID